MLHLLYARFWHKVLHDLGYLTSSEPFHRLVNQGYIQAYAYTDSRGVYVPAAEVEERAGDDGELTFWYQGEQVNREYGKIGKSLKNSVMPDEMYDAYGADTFRVYEMSMGPIEQDRPWETRAVVGAQRFLQRVWRLFVDETTGESVIAEGTADPETLKVAHQVIAGVRDDMDHLRFNTAISKLIVLTNHLTKQGAATADVLEPLAIMLSLRPAPGRRAVVAARPRVLDHLRRLPGGGPRLPRRRHRHRGRPGQGEGPGPSRRRPRHLRGRPRGARSRVVERPAGARRSRRAQGHRQGAEARQHRPRGLSPGL